MQVITVAFDNIKNATYRPLLLRELLNTGTGATFVCNTKEIFR